MKKLLLATIALPALLSLAPSSAQASGCQNAVSFVILSSGDCQVLSGEKPMKPVKSIPFSFTRVRLKGSGVPDYLMIAGQITNQSTKTYRTVLITFEIGNGRVEQYALPGLIRPGQTQKFEFPIDRDRTSVRNAVYVQNVEYLEL